MPYDFKWYDDEHSIIQLDMTGEVSWNGWYQAMDIVFAELDQATQRIDMILYDMTGMPKGNPMPHVKNTMKKLESYDNLGKVVLVNAKKRSTFAKVILDVVIRAMQITSGRHGIFVNTLDEALDIIEKDRAVQENTVNL